jgi:glycosyltransferase involved in cell wall biosynthesis
MHSPFAFFLVSILKPKLFVELGVHTGHSYNAFCQAVKALKTGTCCYGIDTWKGDKHAGFYSEDVYQQLLEYQLKEYSEFSHLLRMTFDEGLAYFSNQGIDLLHIDGLHTYEAVKHDFEEWLPKMNDKGVILLHDTMMRERDFGVWGLWNEIAPKYPSFNFTYGYGLGIVAVGSNVSKEFLDFLNEANNNPFYQKLFFSLGMLCSFDAFVEERDTRIESLEDAIREKDDHIGNLGAALNHIYNSHGWKALLVYYRLRDRFLPVGSKRKKAAKFVWNIFQKKRLKRASKILRTEERTFDQLPKQIKTDSNIQTETNIEAVIKNLDTTLEKNIQIAFVGQPEYFRFMYEDLDKDYNVKDFVLKWGAGIQFYKGLIEFNPHVAFFFRPELYPDTLLETLKGIKVALSSEPIPKYANDFFITSDDMELRFNSLKCAKGKKYDYFFHYDKTSLRFLEENGFKVDGEFFFPVATGIYRPIDCKKNWDWGFIGRDTIHRERFLGVAKRDFNGLHIAHGIYGEEFVRLMNACKIGVNLHIDKSISLEPRMQMMMACKVMTMSEPLSHNDLFKPGIHYVEFTQPEEFWEKLRYYLEHDDEREEIALNGFRLVRECLSTRAVFPKLIGYMVSQNKSSLVKRVANISSHKKVFKKQDSGIKRSVAFFIPGQGISGGIMVVCQHANRLIRKGYAVVLINNNPNDPFKLDWVPNLLPKVIPIDKIDQDIDIAIAIATHWSTAYTVRNFPAKRKLYFVQSDETRFNPPCSEEVETARKTYAFDFEFVVIARWLREWLQDNFGKSAHYVPNGLDSSIFYPDKPLTPKGDKLRVLLEGPIDVPSKGMEEAFQVADGIDCEVWCVSTFGRPKSNWKCDRFFKNVSQEMMRKIYSSCDVLVKMSKVEGFFMPPLEMMACGGTVITGKVTGYDEYIVDGYNALVVEEGDVESAREKLILLINDRNLLHRLIKGGLETVKNWTWEYSNDQLEKIIKGELRLTNGE